MTGGSDPLCRPPPPAKSAAHPGEDPPKARGGTGPGIQHLMSDAAQEEPTGEVKAQATVEAMEEVKAPDHSTGGAAQTNGNPPPIPKAADDTEKDEKEKKRKAEKEAADAEIPEKQAPRHGEILVGRPPRRGPGSSNMRTLSPPRHQVPRSELNSSTQSPPRGARLAPPGGQGCARRGGPVLRTERRGPLRLHALRRCLRPGLPAAGVHLLAARAAWPPGLAVRAASPQLSAAVQAFKHVGGKFPSRSVLQNRRRPRRARGAR